MKRIAILLTVPTRDPELAQAASFGEEADIVLASSGDLGGPDYRPIEWQTLDAETARRAMLYNGDPAWRPAAPRYAIAEDWMQQFCDCDLWIVVGDALSAPLLPLRPSLRAASVRDAWRLVRECL